VLHAGQTTLRAGDFSGPTGRQQVSPRTGSRITIPPRWATLLRISGGGILVVFSELGDLVGSERSDNRVAIRCWRRAACAATAGSAT